MPLITQPGMRVKASAYRALGHLAPAVVDGMELWQVGVLLGNHETAPGSDRAAEAEAILAAKAAKVKAVERSRT